MYTRSWSPEEDEIIMGVVRDNLGVNNWRKIAVNKLQKSSHCRTESAVSGRICALRRKMGISPEKEVAGLPAQEVIEDEAGLPVVVPGVADFQSTSEKVDRILAIVSRLLKEWEGSPYAA